jgi:N-methylhydantoinase A
MSGKIIAVDVGGTFTDVVAVEDGRITTAKVATQPSSSDRSVLAGARALGVSDASVFNLASTAGLNAVLTRRLPKVGFLITEGHRDVLDRGSLVRPLEAITDPTWRRNFGDAGGRPIVPRYLRRGIHERLTPRGEVFIPLDEAQAREQIEVLKRCNVRGVAICLLHAHRNDVHEQRLRELVREILGDIPVSISSATSALVREFHRASTTVMDVLMKNIYGDYTRRLQDGLDEVGFAGEFNYADCSANLLPSDYAMRRPYQLLMGGPAGGAVSAAHFGGVIGDDNLLCADVGGTSTDISVIVDGAPWSSSTFEVEHDLVVSATSINIVTLGAGGGSLVMATASGDIATGPDSAGAEPGPACYGDGGTRPAVTDAALCIGILTPGGFLGGKKRLHPDLALKAFESLDTPLPLSQRIRHGWNMAVNNIAEGLLNISIGRGVDPRDFSLVACGAAGPMILPCLLDQFPIRRVIVPPYPGLFSALGLISTDRVYSDHRGRYMVLAPESAPILDAMYAAMEERLLNTVGAGQPGLRVVRTFDARFLGQSWETPLIETPSGRIDAAAVQAMIDTFRATYEKLNANRFDNLPVEAVTYRVQVIVPAAKVTYPAAEPGARPEPVGETVLRHLYDEPTRAFEYNRDVLGVGAEIAGPAVIREEMSTTFVPAGRRATVGARREIIVE